MYRIGMTRCTSWKPPPVSASADDATACLNALYSMRMAVMTSIFHIDISALFVV